MQELNPLLKITNQVHHQKCLKGLAPDERIELPCVGFGDLTVPEHPMKTGFYLITRWVPG